MTWETRASATTTASTERIWALWADVQKWNTWDHEVLSSTLNGPFELGTTGTLKPRGGPTAKFVITELTPMISFSDMSKLPLTEMRFHHRISTANGVTTVEHRVVMTGMLSPIFGRLIGTKIAKGLPIALAKLVALAQITGP